jgi:threonine synthase
MRYISTDSTDEFHSFETAVLKGWAPDGGMYLPEIIPKIGNYEEMLRLSKLTYPSLCVEIFSKFTSPEEVTSKERETKSESLFKKTSF